MATQTIYTIVYPSDPNSISVGSSGSFVVVSLSPPPSDSIAIAVYTQTITTDDPTINQPSADGLDFTADGDDWKAPLPPIPSLTEINIPVGPAASPDNVFITYQFEPLKIAQEIGQLDIYVSSGSSILKIDQDGNTIKTIITNETVNQIWKSQTENVIWLGTSKDLYDLSNEVSTKIGSVGTVLALGSATSGSVLVLDDKGLSSEDINNFYIRVHSSSGYSRKTRLTDDPYSGSFSFNRDGSVYAHGTSLNPAATVGHDFAVLSAYYIAQRVWRHTFSDWSYGANSREKVVASMFDNDDNCYCVTEAWEETISLSTLIRPKGLETFGEPKTMSSDYSTQTFVWNMLNIDWSELQFCSFFQTGPDSWDTVEGDLVPFRLRMTEIILTGQEGDTPVGPLDVTGPTYWSESSGGFGDIYHDGSAWVIDFNIIESPFGPAFYAQMENNFYSIAELQITFTMTPL